MKAAIQYFFFLLVGLLLGVSSLHASKPPAPNHKISNHGLALQTGANQLVFDQAPAGSEEDDSIFSDEDDEDDCSIRKLSTFFRGFLALTQYFQLWLSQEQSKNSLSLDDHFSLGSPRYILQRVIRI